jgi:hypothetical protein
VELEINILMYVLHLHIHKYVHCEELTETKNNDIKISILPKKSSYGVIELTRRNDRVILRLFIACQVAFFIISIIVPFKGISFKCLGRNLCFCLLIVDNF